MNERKKKILDFVHSHGFASPDDLAGLLNISAITVRRDLDRLAKEGALKRVHGGAVPSENSLAASPISTRLHLHPKEKRELAVYAATLIRPRDAIFLDAGSTCYFLAEVLPEDAELIVITHSLDNLNALKGKRGVRVICVGGELDPLLNAFLGPLAETELESFTVHKAFLGTAAINARAGCANNTLAEKRIKTLMNSRARESYVLADASKFSQDSLCRTLPASALKNLITNASAPASQIRQFKKEGVKVHLVASRT